MKKAASIVGAGALLLAMSLPVLGRGHGHDNHQPKDEGGDLTIANFACVQTNTASAANSGANFVMGGSSQHDGHHGKRGGHDGGSEGGSIVTGAAYGWSDVGTTVNHSRVACGDCLEGDTVITNFAGVRTNTLSLANSGMNFVKGEGKVRTGVADAYSVVRSNVNSTVVGY